MNWTWNWSHLQQLIVRKTHWYIQRKIKKYYSFTSFYSAYKLTQSYFCKEHKETTKCPGNTVTSIISKQCKGFPTINNQWTIIKSFSPLSHKRITIGTNLPAYSALDWPAREDKIMPTMSPYNANASAKMRIRIIPTKSLGCWALALQNGKNK